MEGVNRRGFFKALGALVAAPVAWKLAPKEETRDFTGVKARGETKAFASFDTSTIPANATITGVAVWNHTNIPYVIVTWYDAKGGRAVADVRQVNA